VPSQIENVRRSVLCVHVMYTQRVRLSLEFDYVRIFSVYVIAYVSAVEKTLVVFSGRFVRHNAT